MASTELHVRIEVRGIWMLQAAIRAVAFLHNFLGIEIDVDRTAKVLCKHLIRFKAVPWQK